MDGEKEFQVVGDMADFQPKEEEEKKDGETNGKENGTKSGAGKKFTLEDIKFHWYFHWTTLVNISCREKLQEPEKLSIG